MQPHRLPVLTELPEKLQRAVNPANPKLLMAVAKGLAPLDPQTLLESWVYLSHTDNPMIADASLQSIKSYPEAALLQTLKLDLAPWALEFLGEIFIGNDAALEVILLNQNAPDELFSKVAPKCSEYMTSLIANNQERIIQSPEIISALESNPKNLKSNTDRLRHFLRLAGVFIPGDASSASLDDKPVNLPVEGEGDTEDADASAEKALKESSHLTEEQRSSLLNYILKLNVGSKIKLAFKGNKEARQILIRDVNKIVALTVLKSPRINENEVALYASLRNVCDEVIRTISSSPQWTKSYQVKLAICRHPKSPLTQSMAFLKFLTMRDLNKLTKDKNVVGPLKKAAKELLSLKRK